MLPWGIGVEGVHRGWSLALTVPLRPSGVTGRKGEGRAEYVGKAWVCLHSDKGFGFPNVNIIKPVIFPSWSLTKFHIKHWKESSKKKRF